MRGDILISFAAGTLVGGIAGIFGSKKYFEKKAKKTIDERCLELEEYYEHNDEFKRVKLNDELKEVTTNTGRENGILPTNERDQLRNSKYEKIRTDYKGIYKSQYVDPAEKEHPEDDSDADSERAFDEHQQNKKRPPRIISFQTLGELGNEWEEKTLMYYIENDVLTTEEDVPIEDRELLVGDCLDKYGFVNSDEEIIYVQNFTLNTVYEVQKIFSEYEEE